MEVRLRFKSVSCLYVKVMSAVLISKVFFYMCYSDLKESRSLSFSVRTSTFLLQFDEMFAFAYKNTKKFSVMSWLYGLLKKSGF